MKLLDLFCGAGGAAMGYSRAGFTEIVGVDIAPQPNYPFTFIQGDALQPPVKLSDFDLIHASPPCQSYSRAMKHLAAPQPMLLDPVRELLQQSGVPWIIENVPGAPLTVASDLFGGHGTILCGKSFGLRIIRHRLFETSFPVIRLDCTHTGEVFNPHNEKTRQKFMARYGRQTVEIPWRAEMGVPWMGRYEAREAIPPAYTAYLGRQFLAHLGIQGGEVGVSGVVLDGSAEHPTDEGEFGGGEGHSGSFRLAADDLTKPASNVKETL